MTHRLYAAPGRITAHIKVTSAQGKRLKQSIEEATNSSTRISRDYRTPAFMNGLRKNAMYKHRLRYGLGTDVGSGELDTLYNTEILDFDIRYFDDIVVNKRVQRLNKKTGKKENYAVTRNRQTKKLVGRVKWKTVERLD